MSFPNSVIFLCFSRCPLEKLAASEACVSNTAKSASARVSQMLNLRNVVRNLPLLQKALEGSRSQLLRIIHDVGAYSVLCFGGLICRSNVV